MAQGQHEAKRGDLIEIFRPVYQHFPMWAVYIGNYEVVHLTSPDDKGSSSSGNIISFSSSGFLAEVKRENIWKVVDGCKFRVNNLLDHKYKPRDPDVIVMKACKKVGKMYRYSLTSANCEHFATDMRYGKAESRQVVVAEIATAATVGAVIVGALVAVASADDPEPSEKSKEQK